MNFNKNVLMFVLNDCNPDPRVLKLANTLVKDKFKVKIVATHFNKQIPKKEILDNGVIIERFGIIQIPIVQYAHYWIKSIIKYKSQKADIIVCHDLNVLPIGTYFKFKNKSKLVYDTHEFFPGMLGESKGRMVFWTFATLEKQLIKTPDYIITVSQSLAEFFKWYYKLKNPIDYTLNVPNKSILDLPVDDSHRGKNEFILVSVGIVSAIFRGFELIPDFAATIKKLRKSTDPKIKLLIIGDGPYRQELQSIIKRTRHDDIVSILGYIPYDRAMSISKGCDIGLILTQAISISNIYSGPNRLFDYLGNHLPFITTDLYEMRRIAEKEGCGWVIPLNDSEALAQTVLNIARDRSQLKDKKENTKIYFNKKYNWEVMEDKILHIYRNL